MATVDDVDTGVEIPAIPGSCTELTTSVADSLAAVSTFKGELQESLNFGAWLSEQLGEACKEPTE